MYSDVKMALSRPITPRLICLILSLFIIWQLADTAMVIISSNQGPTNTVILDKRIDSKRNDASLSLKMPLFGEYMPVDLKNSEIKQSMLNLEVVGIIFSADEQTSHVIIRTASGKDQTFHVGDKLPGGVIIKRITAEGVLVSRDGSIERLELPKNDLLFEPIAKPIPEEKM